MHDAKVKASGSCGHLHSETNIFPYEGLVALPQILQYLDIKKTCWWQGVADGRFPKQIKLGRASRWRAVDIRALAKEAGA